MSAVTTLSGLLSRRATLILGGMLAAGFVLRVVVAWKTYGQVYDIHSLAIIANALDPGGIGAYDTNRWPYPGGFLPFLWLANRATDDLGLRFDGVVQLPAIVADMAIAAIVAAWLRLRAFSERKALFGAALVALGPSFFIVSGYHGQIDAVAALPAFVGVLLWTRGGQRRALYAGLLIGLGAAVKQPLAFAVLALLPTADSWRERWVLLGATILVPVVSVAPWLVSDTHDVIRAMRQNSGVPGFGGLSAFVQPDLTRSWSTVVGSVPASGATLDLVDAQRTIVAAGAIAAGALLWVRRVPAVEGAAFVFLTIYVINPNFGFTYLLWGAPYLIACGYLLEVALFELVSLLAMAWLYWRPGLNPDGWSYLITVQLLWLSLVLAFVCAAVRIARRPALRAAAS